MHYSKIRSRAGLVVLVFAFIISFVSSVPIPTTESRLSSTSPPRSNPSLNGQVDTASSSLLSGRLSTPPTVTRTLARRQDVSTNMDDQLVRRGVASHGGGKIKHAFQKVKQGLKKAWGAIKRHQQEGHRKKKNEVERRMEEKARKNAEEHHERLRKEVEHRKEEEARKKAEEHHERLRMEVERQKKLQKEDARQKEVERFH